jgi:hypothetical protein
MKLNRNLFELWVCTANYNIYAKTVIEELDKNSQTKKTRIEHQIERRQQQQKY